MCILLLSLITCTIKNNDLVRYDNIFFVTEMYHNEEIARSRLIHIKQYKEITRTDCIPTRETFLNCAGNMIEEENSIILLQRERLIDIQITKEISNYISLENCLWLQNIKTQYGTNDEKELLKRVNIIPLEMAIAQSILESGWGTSYAARIGKGLFGQIQSSGNHSVLVPWSPGPDRPQPFTSHRESVTAYFINLNTHPAYAGMRAAREHTLNPIQLMNHMQRYSIRGNDYIKQIQGIIVTFQTNSLK